MEIFQDPKFLPAFCLEAQKTLQHFNRITLICLTGNKTKVLKSDSIQTHKNVKVAHTIYGQTIDDVISQFHMIQSNCNEFVNKAGRIPYLRNFILNFYITVELFISYILLKSFLATS